MTINKSKRIFLGNGSFSTTSTFTNTVLPLAAANGWEIVFSVSAVTSAGSPAADFWPDSLNWEPAGIFDTTVWFDNAVELCDGADVPLWINLEAWLAYGHHPNIEVRVLLTANVIGTEDGGDVDTIEITSSLSFPEPSPPAPGMTCSIEDKDNWETCVIESVDYVNKTVTFTEPLRHSYSIDHEITDDKAKIRTGIWMDKNTPTQWYIDNCAASFDVIDNNSYISGYTLEATYDYGLEWLRNNTTKPVSYEWQSCVDSPGHTIGMESISYWGSHDRDWRLALLDECYYEIFKVYDARCAPDFLNYVVDNFPDMPIGVTSFANGQGIGSRPWWCDTGETSLTWTQQTKAASSWLRWIKQEVKEFDVFIALVTISSKSTNVSIADQLAFWDGLLLQEYIETTKIDVYNSTDQTLSAEIGANEGGV